LLGILIGVAAQTRAAVTISVQVAPGLIDRPVDGRLLVIVSATPGDEPRFQVEDAVETAQLFGIDVEAWGAGVPRAIDASVLGYPLESTAELPAGKYWVQAVLHRYETFRRQDGHVVKLPMDRGEGQVWNKAPGNLVSEPIEVLLRREVAQQIELVLTRELPPIEPPKDTQYVRHERIESKLLSQFWGRPMYLGAHVLLPEGWAEHPEARYPLLIQHGHFSHEFHGWRESPPDPELKPEYSKRFRIEGYNRIEQQGAYQLFNDWTAPGFPRVIVVEIQHANPYYDDSYAVDSANLGPYGQAIQTELIPYLEKKYRAIGAGWARFVYGGSTGGWEAMAVQILYPDFYNGAYIACPDPIDFRAYTVVNIYQDSNAYYIEGPFKRTLRPAHRDYLGHVKATLEDVNRRELVLGTHSRSGDQWDIWQAVFSPVGPNGYPQPIWDKRTGQIDREVASYWKEHYDLTAILTRDWKNGLGSKLRGKLHLYCGDMDNYYLNNAVYLAEDFLRSTTDPPFEGVVDYGDRAEHCWNGDHTRPNAYSRLRYVQMFAPKAVERMLKTAPPGADLKSWRY
jgi:hypothetical protein